MKRLAIALLLSLAACGGAPFTIQGDLAPSDASGEKNDEIDAGATNSAGDATYEATYNPEADAAADAGHADAAPDAPSLPEASPPERDALAPETSTGRDARPDVSPEASPPDAAPDREDAGGACKVHADCAGTCGPTDLKPVCDDPGGFGKGTCWCSGCTANGGTTALEPKCVAYCASVGKTADAGARPYCEGPGTHHLPDGTAYTATVCYCGI